MKLETNMYVRTPLGIDKIKDSLGCYFALETNGMLRWNNNEKVNWFSIDGECFDKNDLKANHSLLELVEPGDLMYIDISPDNYGGIVVPRVAETLNELNKWKTKFASGECILKTILTKEQIINSWYEVGEK